MKNVTLGGVMPIFLIIACIAGGYFFSYTQYQEYQASREQIAAAQEKLDAVTQAKNDLDGFLAEYRRSLSDQPIVDRALPPEEPNVPVVLALLEQLGNNSGLNMEGLNAIEERNPAAAEPNSVQYLDFDVKVSGTYAEFYNFLILLEQNLRVSDIQSISVRTTETANLAFDLKIRVYYQK